MWYHYGLRLTRYTDGAGPVLFYRRLKSGGDRYRLAPQLKRGEKMEITEKGVRRLLLAIYYKSPFGRARDLLYRLATDDGVLESIAYRFDVLEQRWLNRHSQYGTQPYRIWRVK